MEEYCIFLAITFFIVNNPKICNNNIIIVPNKIYKHMLRDMFPKYGFTKSGKGFHISIKSKEHGNLIINNIDNLNEIKTKYIFYIPLSNYDNPVIMFKYDEDRKLRDHDKIKQSFRTYYDNNFFKSWENNILKEYVGNVERNLTEELISPIDKIRFKLMSYFNVPFNNVPVYIPMANITIESEGEKSKPCPTIQSGYSEVINKLTNYQKIFNKTG